MARTEQGLIAFNRGLISRLAVARVDLKRSAFSARRMVNWMPRALGSMMLRPGLGYLFSTASDAASRAIPFVFSNDDTALLEFTNTVMRVIINDVVLTRPTVTSTITNGTFSGNITGWTDNDEAGGTSVYVAGDFMGLTGNGTANAIRDQQITVAGGNIGVEHALRIVITRGPVILKVGSSSGGDQYIHETQLETGTHSLALTPTGDFFIRFMSPLERQVLVKSCTMESAGAVSITSPYLTADLGIIRGGTDSQSADVIFLACNGYQQRRIERRAPRSWSLVLYYSNDGPFRLPNITATTLTPSVLSGNGTFTASAPVFRSTHVGAIFSITNNGQNVTESITAQNVFSDTIEVTGVEAVRIFSYSVNGLSGTGSTVTLQRSLESSSGPFTDIASFTADEPGAVFDDGLDNQIAYYRLGVKTGDYSSGTIVVAISYAAGAITGIGRVTAFSSSTVVSMEVLQNFGNITASDDWAEGEWSDFRGWPTAVCFHEGRLEWAGRGSDWLSASDLFDVFDPEFEGDAGPISKKIGSGPVDNINWALSLQRSLLGGDSAEFSVKSSSFDEPLTPTNCNIKADTTQGSARVQAVKVDGRGVFIQRGGTRVFELALSSDISTYEATDLTLMVPEIGLPQIVRFAVQRQPDTRFHCVRSDGTAAVMIYDRSEQVLCWLEVESPGAGGLIEDVVVLPSAAGRDEDHVYYVVNRTINGSTKRYWEKWALESEAVGGNVNKQADSFVTFSRAAASNTVTGLGHLEGKEVIVWQDGVCPEDDDLEPQTYTVTSAQITLDVAALAGMVGLAYEGQWQSAKLGTALTHIGKTDHIGLVLVDTHPRGLKFGPDFDHLDPMPEMFDYAQWDMDDIHDEFDQPPIIFPGQWSSDPRMCLEAQAPRPVTVCGAIAIGERNA